MEGYGAETRAAEQGVEAVFRLNACSMNSSFQHVKEGTIPGSQKTPLFKSMFPCIELHTYTGCAGSEPKSMAKTSPKRTLVDTY